MATPTGNSRAIAAAFDGSMPDVAHGDVGGSGAHKMRRAATIAADAGANVAELYPSKRGSLDSSSVRKVDVDGETLPARAPEPNGLS